MPVEIAVCTASVTDHDPLVNPAFVAPNVRYLCATDRTLPDDSLWSHREPLPDNTPIFTARRTKLLAYKWAGTVDLTLWIDSRFELQIDPHMLLPLALRHDVLVFRHPWCHDLTSEAAAITQRGLKYSNLQRQIDAYHKAGFPDREHSSTGFLVRRNSARVNRFSAMWWEEVRRYGHPRDQMSFDYCAWKCDVDIGYLEGQYQDNPYATWHQD